MEKFGHHSFLNSWNCGFDLVDHVLSPLKKWGWGPLCPWKQILLHKLLTAYVRLFHTTMFSYRIYDLQVLLGLHCSHNPMLHFPRRIFKMFTVLILSNLTLSLWYYLLIHKKLITCPARTLNFLLLSLRSSDSHTPASFLSSCPRNSSLVQTQPLYMCSGLQSCPPPSIQGLTQLSPALSWALLSLFVYWLLVLSTETHSILTYLIEAYTMFPWPRVS